MFCIILVGTWDLAKNAQINLNCIIHLCLENIATGYHLYQGEKRYTDLNSSRDTIYHTHLLLCLSCSESTTYHFLLCPCCAYGLDTIFQANDLWFRQFYTILYRRSSFSTLPNFFLEICGTPTGPYYYATSFFPSRVSGDEIWL